MKNTLSMLVLCITAGVVSNCSSSKNISSTAPTVQRIPATFDFVPPVRDQAGSAGITIAIVKPMYVGKNPEYYVPPFNEMATSMGNDFEELLTAKGFSMRGPFGSRDEMVYNDKLSSDFILEVGIELNPKYNRTYRTKTKTNWNSILDNRQAPSITTHRMYGEVTLAGNLVINAKSSQYGELLWKKNIALAPSSFTYTGSLNWEGLPTMDEELNKDNQVYNTVSTELEKFYTQALTLAWQQIDKEEMKQVAEQGKKADKRN